MDFKLKRYTVKFDDDYSRLNGVGMSKMTWQCEDALDVKVYNTVVCSLAMFNTGEQFTYNKKTKRFSYYSGGVFGPIQGNNAGSDTNHMYAGTCEKF